MDTSGRRGKGVPVRGGSDIYRRRVKTSGAFRERGSFKGKVRKNIWGGSKKQIASALALDEKVRDPLQGGKMRAKSCQEGFVNTGKKGGRRSQRDRMRGRIVLSLRR